jgi:hypothetical protein
MFVYRQKNIQQTFNYNIFSDFPYLKISISGAVPINFREKNSSLCLISPYQVINRDNKNQRLPGACNRSPGSKLLSITTQLHCGSYLGGRARLPDTILEENHPMTISSKFCSY